MKIAVFVDGSNFGAALKNAGFRVDYSTILENFRKFGEVVTACYFTALPPSSQPSAIRNLTDHLYRDGWKIISKPVKVFKNPRGTKIKGDMDVDIAVHACSLAHRKMITHLVLLSGDGDFTAMVKYLKSMGVQVICISHRASGPDNVMAEELRLEADEFIDLSQLRELFERKT